MLLKYSVMLTRIHCLGSMLNMQFLDLKLCSLKIWMFNKSLIVLLKLPFIREINIQNCFYWNTTVRLRVTPNLNPISHL